MPGDITTLRVDPDLVVVEVHGHPGRLELQRAIEALSQHPSPPLARLWDLRQADFTAINGAHIAELARYARSLAATSEPRRDRQRRVALLVEGDLQFGMMRMFESLHGERADVSLHVFRDEGEARAWLGPTIQAPS